jgi:YidC/Oxa1 family membrane protein insertase
MLTAIIPVIKQLEDACEAVLHFWHNLLGNFDGSWGWSIILLTFTVRLAILPLTFKGVKSMQRMQQLQPEIKRIQERYKGDRQRMNQEIMAFYQREKVNPLGSCLPLALQLPFFLALFQVLRSHEFQKEIADNPTFGPIPDLAQKVTHDPVLLGSLIVLYVGTQLAASAVTAVSADPTQRRIMLGMPFVFVFFIINFQAGLIVYWITTNVWTIGQQLLVKKLYPKPEPRDPGEIAESKPARGKPPAEAVADGDSDGKGAAKVKSPAKPKAKAKAASSGGGNGGSGKAPPPSPRKKKKRSGRRR